MKRRPSCLWMLLVFFPLAWSCRQGEIDIPWLKNTLTARFTEVPDTRTSYDGYVSLDNFSWNADDQIAVHLSNGKYDLVDIYPASAMYSRPFYGSDGTEINLPHQIMQGPVSFGTAIQNPYTFYYNTDRTTYDWCNVTYHNHWNTANTGFGQGYWGIAVTKSICDPSPVGFKMNPQFSWSVLTTDTFKPDNALTGRIYNNAVYFPAQGRLSYADGSILTNRAGRYWSASASAKNAGVDLHFDTNDLITHNGSARTMGLLVLLIPGDY